MPDLSVDIALSLRQPWAWLVLHGGKRIENRRWSTRVRGPFFIHAAKGCTRDEYEDAVSFARSVASAIVVPPLAKLERGGIVGRARLVDVVKPCARPPETLECTCGRPWHMGEQHGFLLEDVAPVPFSPCRGELGFFKVVVEGTPPPGTLDPLEVTP